MRRIIELSRLGFDQFEIQELLDQISEFRDLKCVSFKDKSLYIFLNVADADVEKCI